MADKILQAINEVDIETSDSERFLIDPVLKVVLADSDRDWETK